MQYDRRNKRVGFLETKGCSSLQLQPPSDDQQERRSPLLLPPLVQPPTAALSPPPPEKAVTFSPPPPHSPAGGSEQMPVHPQQNEKEDEAQEEGEGEPGEQDPEDAYLKDEEVVAGGLTMTPFIAAVAIVVLVLVTGQLAFTHRVKIYGLFALGWRPYHALPVSDSGSQLASRGGV